MQGHGRIIAHDFCVAHREANSGLSTLNRTKSILSIYHQQRQLQKQRGMCLNDTYPFCQQPLSGNCHSICFSKPVLWTATPPRSFFVTRRAQQPRARMQPVAVLPSLAPHGSKARLRAVTKCRDSWRSHVHRTRFRRLSSSSSLKTAMSGGRGGSPSSFPWDSKGGILFEKRMPPLFDPPCGLAGENSAALLIHLASASRVVRTTRLPARASTWW